MEREIQELHDRLMQMDTTEGAEEFRDALLDVVEILQGLQERIEEHWRETKRIDDDA